MDTGKKAALEKTAARVRIGALTGIHSARSGHPGGSLSIADILTYLYFEEMDIDPGNPDRPERDRLVLSKGHTAPALYSVLAERGFFDRELLRDLRKPDSILQGHPEMRNIPGVDMTTGSLGLGVSAACGMALSGKVSGSGYRVYAILGDGELEEGQVWEAAMFAAHYKLDNLLVIVDYNGLQIDGKLSEVVSPEPIADKFAAFGFEVFEIDGHDFSEIESAVRSAKSVKDRPTCIVARTVKGKGVSYMENEAAWHGNAPNDEQFATAMDELSKILSDGGAL